MRDSRGVARAHPRPPANSAWRRPANTEALIECAKYRCSMTARCTASSVVQAQTEAVKKRVQSFAPDIPPNPSEHDLIRSLVEEFRLSVPVVNEEDKYIVNFGESPADVSRDLTRLTTDRSQPHHIQGTKTVTAVPFEGDAGFFTVQRKYANPNPPRG